MAQEDCWYNSLTSPLWEERPAFPFFSTYSMFSCVFGLEDCFEMGLLCAEGWMVWDLPSVQQAFSPLVMILLVLQVLSAQSHSPCSSFSISYFPAGHTGSLCPVVSLCHHCFVGLPSDAWSPTSSKGALSACERCAANACWPLSQVILILRLCLALATSAWITSTQEPLHWLEQQHSWEEWSGWQLAWLSS